VWQLFNQFPQNFEFSEKLLLLISREVSTNLWRQFTSGSEKEFLKNSAPSLWKEILRGKKNCSEESGKFWKNFAFRDLGRILFPNLW
jgi:hypothetical protein